MLLIHLPFLFFLLLALRSLFLHLFPKTSYMRVLAAREYSSVQGGHTTYFPCGLENVITTHYDDYCERKKPVGGNLREFSPNHFPAIFSFSPGPPHSAHLFNSEYH